MIVFAREAIFDRNQQLFAYQLVFRDGEQGSLPNDLSLGIEPPPENDAHSKIKSFENIGLNELLSGFTSVVSVTRQSLLSDVGMQFVPDDTIFEIEQFHDTDANKDTELLSAIQKLKQAGFCISMQLDDTKDVNNETNLRQSSLVNADFIKIDIQKNSAEDIDRLRIQLLHETCKTIAVNVDTLEQYQHCLEAGFDYFQGFFFLKRAHKKEAELPANKLSLLRLLAQTSDNTINMEEIRQTFEHDPTLSYLLMRFINNPMVKKSHKITSIKHALTYLGEVMLRKFVAIISVAQLNKGNMRELLELSLVRAKYCELLNSDSSKALDAMSAFMAGLFSLIDVILDKDMEELLGQIPISPEIAQALLEKTGPYHALLASVKALESSSWLQFKEYALQLDVDEEMLQAHYLKAVRWNNELLKGQSDMFPTAKPQG